MGLLKQVVTSAIVNATIKTVGNVAINAADTAMKNPQSYIYTIGSSDDYYRKNYQDVVAEFQACGFANVSVLPIKDLINGWIIKDGSVETISINGKENFKKKAKFKPDATVVIKYHTKK